MKGSTSMSRPGATSAEVFKALSDPVRWSIIEQLASRAELPCRELEDTLPVSKPTISYHVKVLSHAGLLETRKRGRNYYYSLHHDVIRQLVSDLGDLLPGLRLVQAPGTTTTSHEPVPIEDAVGATPPIRGKALPTW